MSKCKAVHDEKKIFELTVRQKEAGQIIVKKVVKAITVPEQVVQEETVTQPR